MTEYELDAFQSEFDPIAMADSLSKDNSRENKIKHFAVLKTSYFLALAQQSGQVATLKNKEGKQYIALFTCRAELEKWPFPRTEMMEISYENAKKIVVGHAQLDGLAINPFGQTMFLERQHLAEVDMLMQSAASGGKREMKLKATRDYPMGLPSALQALLSEHPEVYRVWLMAAHNANEHLDHKLFIVDFDGQTQPLFSLISKAIQPYLRLGEPVEMMKADLKLVRIAEQATKPLYEKK